MSTEYWVWLQHAFGAGSAKPVAIGRRFHDLEEFYKGGKALWRQFSFIKESEIEALSAFSKENAEDLINYSERMDARVIAYDDVDYPEKLKQIDNPPAVLYASGNFPDFDENLVVSVVGARKASTGAVKMTENICYELSQAGAIVVSGGALGIDGAAHRGALKGLSPTCAMLACGIGFPYLMQNQSLRNKIKEKGGALITEYPVNSGVNKGNFVIRNRIISALCNGLLVSECAVKGGTMLTVNHALKQNKDVFAFPGDINNPMAEGSNRLIRDGAVPVLEVRDILDEYTHILRKPKEKTDDFVELKTKSPIGLSKSALDVYNVLGKEPVHVSFICESTGLKVSQVLAAITELELTDNAKTYSGQRCSLI